MNSIQFFSHHTSDIHLKSAPFGIFFLFTMLFFIGCSDKSSTEACDSDLLISVGPGTTPKFSWEPKCNLAILIVEKNDGEDMWMIISDGNTIASGVVYGVVPAGVNEIFGPGQLSVGTTYRVGVYWRIGPGDGFESFSSPYVKTFTP